MAQKPKEERLKNKLKPTIPTLDTMSKTEFDAVIENGYNQAVNGESIELDAAFKILKRIED